MRELERKVSSVEHIILNTHPIWSSVRQIIFNRPEKRNALTLVMWQQLLETLRKCHADPQVRVVILRGIDDSAFCSGADIAEFPLLRSDQKQATQHKEITDLVTRTLTTLRPITLAAISGVCYGGGLQLATACDIRIGTESARFAITPVKLGFVYGPYETTLLMRIIGETKAKELLYTGKAITALEAHRMGFISDISSASDTLDQLVNQTVYALLQAAPKAQQTTKRLFQQLADSHKSDQTYANLEELARSAMEGLEYKEGIQAFLEKRRPTYTEGEPPM